MNAPLAALLIALIASYSTPAFSADGQKNQEKAAKAKAAPRADPPGELFSKAQKALKERAAKTAEVVRKNVANIKKRVSGEPEAPSKKPEPKSVAKDKKNKKDKKDKGTKPP